MIGTNSVLNTFQMHQLIFHLVPIGMVLQFDSRNALPIGATECPNCYSWNGITIAQFKWTPHWTSWVSNWFILESLLQLYNENRLPVGHDSINCICIIWSQLVSKIGLNELHPILSTWCYQCIHVNICIQDKQGRNSIVVIRAISSLTYTKLYSSSALSLQWKLNNCIPWMSTAGHSLSLINGVYKWQKCALWMCVLSLWRSVISCVQYMLACWPWFA